MNIAAERAYPTPVAKSPLLPLLLISLMTQKNAPKVKSKFKNQYDYIIVGGGSAGSVVASRLSEKPCVNVLLLEAGKTPPTLTDVPIFESSFRNSDIDWAFKTLPQKHAARELINNQVPLSAGKAVGGSSVTNGMVYVRGNKKDYDGWAEQGADGWSYDDVFRYFLKLENYTNPKYADNGFHAEDGPITVERPNYEGEIRSPLLEAAKLFGYEVVDVNGPRQTGININDANFRNQQRCSAAKGYLVPAEDRTNLDIIAKAFVKKIVIEDGQAVGVIFDFEGETHQVNATREVIVSSGAINTPKLLMLSGIGPEEHLKEHKIPVLANLPVGKNLQDHVSTQSRFVIDRNIPSIIDKILNQSSVEEYIENRTGPFTSTSAVAIQAFLNGNSSMTTYPNYQLYMAEATTGSVKNVIPLKSQAYQDVYEPYEKDPLLICLTVVLHPKSRGTVTLNSTDPYDQPLIDPHYFEESGDIEEMIQGMKTCRKIATSEPMEKIGTKLFNTTFESCEKYLTSGEEDSLFTCEIRSECLSGCHYVGTAKMGNVEDPSTVVDSTLRVKKIKGLRVIDASIMPTLPSGNTNIPTIMIGEKGSDMIKETIKEC